METDLPQVLVLLVAAQRLGELVLARRNTARLKATGAIEHGAGHYPLFVALHASWLIACFALIPATAPLAWGWLVLFVLLQLARLWVIHSLGGRWTTRVLVLPAAPLVARGPYRWLRHPNYWIVAGELIALPLAFGAWELAAAFTLLNLPLTLWRVRVENRALKAAA